MAGPKRNNLNKKTDMDISIYLTPLESVTNKPSRNPNRKKLGDIAQVFTKPDHFPDLTNIDLVILGVNEDRKSENNEGCAQNPDRVRDKFYDLFPGDFKVKMADIGNIRQGHKVSDTYFALMTVVSELIKNNIIPIILGGSQDLTYANYQAYENLGQIINMVSVDTEFDIGDSEEEITSKSFLSNIILHQPNYLFNYTNIGYQTYYVNQESISLMRNMFFDIYRLGDVKANLK